MPGMLDTMVLCHEIIGVCWLTFFAAWVILAMVFGGGRGNGSSRSLGTRLFFVAAIILGIQFASRVSNQSAGGQVLPQPFVNHAIGLAAAGALLCIAGLVFATWARIVLGRNWGMPMSRHADPQLITSGPYHYVRHPIYTGLIAMWIGTVLVYPLTAVPGAAIIIYSLCSAVREEHDMEQRFPDAYPDYRKRSKMLLPFLL